MLKSATAVMLVLCCLLVAQCLGGCGGKTTSETDAAFPITTVAGSGDGTTTESVRWTRLQPGGKTPSGRSGHTLAYDPESGKVILYGGMSSCGVLDDTWELTF